MSFCDPELRNSRNNNSPGVFEYPGVSAGAFADRLLATGGEFAQLTNKRLKHGSFNSVAQLIEAIDVWVSHWNDEPKPFVWTRTAEDIITKVKRGRAKLNHLTKSATDH